MELIQYLEMTKEIIKNVKCQNPHDKIMTNAKIPMTRQLSLMKGRLWV